MKLVREQLYDQSSINVHERILNDYQYPIDGFIHREDIGDMYDFCIKFDVEQQLNQVGIILFNHIHTHYPPDYGKIRERYKWESAGFDDAEVTRFKELGFDLE